MKAWHWVLIGVVILVLIGLFSVINVGPGTVIPVSCLSAGGECVVGECPRFHDTVSEYVCGGFDETCCIPVYGAEGEEDMRYIKGEEGKWIIQGCLDMEYPPVWCSTTCYDENTEEFTECKDLGKINVVKYENENIAVLCPDGNDFYLREGKCEVLFIN